MFWRLDIKLVIYWMQQISTISHLNPHTYQSDVSSTQLDTYPTRFTFTYRYMYISRGPRSIRKMLNMYMHYTIDFLAIYICHNTHGFQFIVDWKFESQWWINWWNVATSSCELISNLIDRIIWIFYVVLMGFQIFMVSVKKDLIGIWWFKSPAQNFQTRLETNFWEKAGK